MRTILDELCLITPMRFSILALLLVKDNAAQPGCAASAATMAFWMSVPVDSGTLVMKF